MAATVTRTLLLPGDEVAPELLPIPLSSSASLKLGPGLSHRPPSTVVANVAGYLHVDQRKHAAWIENNTGRYTPHPNDAVLATVERSAGGEAFVCSLAGASPPALLPHLSFENASKKTRPQLAAGALVYARVVSSAAHNRFQEPELACFDPASGKAEGMGELKGGTVFELSLAMCARLLAARAREEGGLVVLEALARLWPFEVAVGRNGRVWVEAKDFKRTLLVGRCLQETDRRQLGIAEQEKLVRKLAKEIGVE